MKAIVAVDEKWGIGKNNGLLFNIPADMKFFRETTKGHTIVMGYNTLLSFPGSKPLPNRRNIVICPENVDIEGAECVHSLADVFVALKTSETEPFVIGGASFYKTMLPYCSEILVTKVAADGNATVFYENLDDNPDFSCVSESEPVETNGYIIKFTVYKNNNVIKY